MGIGIPVGLAFLTTACSHAPGPDDVLKQYLTDWGKQDYKGMYQLLSDDAKQQITETNFVNRYKAIYQGIEAQGIKLTPKIPDNFKAGKRKNTSFSFTATWQTAMTGSFTETYHATLTKGDHGWGIAWSPSLIFPGLKQGWKVEAQETASTRGDIVDANGQPLATNEQGYDIGLVPKKMKAKSANELAKKLGISAGQVSAALHQSWVKPDLFIPVKTVSAAAEKSLEKALLSIPGVEITHANSPFRVYPNKQVGAHLVGYLGPITAEELTAKRKQEGYQASDVFGQQGLENAFESQLRGQPGGKIFLTDATGNTQKVLAQRQATPGDTVQLTVNLKLQKALDDAIPKQAGSAVVLDPKTGAVLAMASQPGFDPNELATGLSAKQWKQLTEQKNPPLIDRALDAVPPGSSLKPLVAAIALTDNTIKPSTTFPGTDKLKWQKDSSWGNYYVTRVPHPSGMVNLQNALVWSDNIYFAQVGLALGKEKFTQGLEKFGFGKPLSFPLNVTKSQVSDSGTIQSPIQLADSAYGQGQVLVSPLQLADMYTAFLNQGDVLQPYIVKQVSDQSGKVIQSGQRKVLYANVISTNAVAQIQQDLRQVVANPTGTAHGISDVPGWTVSGKTGTAQKSTTGPEWGWFVAWATPNGQTEPKYLIAMAIPNTQNIGESHFTVERVKQFLSSIQP